MEAARRGACLILALAALVHAEQGERRVTRKVDVGPSYVDLPAGCWHLDLSWSGGGHDTLDLAYTKQ
jgi:hypothetical protein